MPRKKKQDADRINVLVNVNKLDRAKTKIIKELGVDISRGTAIDILVEKFLQHRQQ